MQRTLVGSNLNPTSSSTTTISQRVKMPTVLEEHAERDAQLKEILSSHQKSYQDLQQLSASIEAYHVKIAALPTQEQIENNILLLNEQITQQAITLSALEEEIANLTTYCANKQIVAEKITIEQLTSREYTHQQITARINQLNEFTAVYSAYEVAQQNFNRHYYATTPSITTTTAHQATPLPDPFTALRAQLETPLCAEIAAFKKHFAKTIGSIKGSPKIATWVTAPKPAKGVVIQAAEENDPRVEKALAEGKDLALGQSIKEVEKQLANLQIALNEKTLWLESELNNLTEVQARAAAITKPELAAAVKKQIAKKPELIAEAELLTFIRDHFPDIRRLIDLEEKLSRYVQRNEPNQQAHHPSISPLLTHFMRELNQIFSPPDTDAVEKANILLERYCALSELRHKIFPYYFSLKQNKQTKQQLEKSNKNSVDDVYTMAEESLSQQQASQACIRVLTTQVPMAYDKFWIMQHLVEITEKPIDEAFSHLSNLLPERHIDAMIQRDDEAKSFQFHKKISSLFPIRHKEMMPNKNHPSASATLTYAEVITRNQRSLENSFFRPIYEAVFSFILLVHPEYWRQLKTQLPVQSDGLHCLQQAKKPLQQLFKHSIFTQDSRNDNVPSFREQQTDQVCTHPMNKLNK